MSVANQHIVISLPSHCNTKIFMYQRLRWISHGSDNSYHNIERSLVFQMRVHRRLASCMPYILSATLSGHSVQDLQQIFEEEMGMFIGTSIIIIGACVQATCTNLGGFMGGRFVLGFGVAITSTAGPAYVSEMAHPILPLCMYRYLQYLLVCGGIPGSMVHSPHQTFKTICHGAFLSGYSWSSLALFSCAVHSYQKRHDG